MFLIKNLKLPNNRLIEFELHPGENIFITGRNGSGKSLFLRSLAALYPLQYEIFKYQGKKISDWDMAIYRSEVLYLPAFVSIQYLENVDDFFKLPLQFSVYKNFHSTFNYQHYLKNWGLEGAKLKNLSSGQRQMLAILRALSLRPKVLLLDEPTSHLDSEKVLEVEKLLLDWHKESSGQIIMVGHDDNQLKRLGFPSFKL
ncbi:MAG: ATP-binding cassette domain-containing protein [Bacteriovoracaceae bacterium]